MHLELETQKFEKIKQNKYTKLDQHATIFLFQSLKKREFMECKNYVKPRGWA